MSLQKGILLNIPTGMEDKIISTKGLCMLVTDEGAGFFDDIQKKQKTMRVISLCWTNFSMGKGTAWS